MAEDLALNAAYALLLLSTFSRNIQRLRLALIGASICFVIFGLIISNPTMVAWNVLIGGMHAFRYLQFVSARRSVELDAEGRQIQSRLFPDLDDFDFNALWAMGETLRLTPESPLTRAGEVNDQIYLILEGTVLVDRIDRPPIRLGQDDLVGEFSFSNREPAVATVTPAPEALVRVWDHNRLKALDDISPRAARRLTQFISSQLISKLNETEISSS